MIKYKTTRFWISVLTINFIVLILSSIFWKGWAWKSFGLGILLMTLNLAVWFKLFSMFFLPNNHPFFIITIGGIKLVVLSAIIFILMQKLDINPMTFGLGFFIVAISGAYASVRFLKDKES